jgi:hypothetical protein
MKLQRYRLNRKIGKIYLESQPNLIEVGSEIEVIILWASEPTFGKPFQQLPAQEWVQLTFIDRAGNWCYALLNSGTTNALYSWNEYRRKVEMSGRELYEILTTIKFEYTNSDYQWFDYHFSGISGKPGIGERIRSLINSHPEFSLVDIDLDLAI